MTRVILAINPWRVTLRTRFGRWRQVADLDDLGFNLGTTHVPNTELRAGVVGADNQTPVASGHALKVDLASGHNLIHSLIITKADLKAHDPLAPGLSLRI